MIGRKRPLLSSALGRAFLAGADEDQRQTMLKIVRGRGPSYFGLTSEGQIDASFDRLREDFATRGYAWSVSGTEPHISAIALPIQGKDGANGAINLVFFRSALTPQEAAHRFLDPLRRCVAQIEQDANKVE